MPLVSKWGGGPAFGFGVGVGLGFNCNINLLVLQFDGLYLLSKGNHYRTIVTVGVWGI